MTLDQLQARYDGILATLGISRQQYENRMVEFPFGDNRIKELEFLKAEILKASQPASGSAATYASFCRG